MASVPAGNPMPAAPSMAGVAQNTQDQSQQALDAMARYGSAGVKAFQDAQTAGQGYRQQVLGSILGNSGLSGDAQNALSAQVQASLAPRLADMQQGQANLEGDVARGNAMYSKYASEANAALPVIQAQQQSQMGIRDQALQLAQQQIDADKAAKAAAAQHDQQMAVLQLQQQQSQTEAARASAAKAAAAVAPTAEQIFQAPPLGKVNPSAKLPAGDVALSAAKAAYDGQDQATRDMEPFSEFAKGYLAYKGYASPSINSILTPEALSKYGTAANKVGGASTLTPPPPPDVKTAAKALGGNLGDANAVLTGSRWPAVTDAVNQFAMAPLDPTTGKIKLSGDPTGDQFAGLTPWEAFSRWLTSPAANLAQGDTKTLRVATATYKPFLDQIAGT